MNKLLKAAALSLVFVFCFSVIPVAAQEDQPILDATFTDIPSQEQLEIMQGLEPVEEDFEVTYDSVPQPLPPELAEELAAEGGKKTRGVQRVYANVDFDTSDVIDRYEFIGQATATNRTGSSSTLQYTQSSTKTTSWSVSGSVSGTAEVGVKFLAGLKLTVGFTVARSTTTSSSSTALHTITVPNNRRGTIEAWHSAGYAKGYIPWYDVDTANNDVLGSGRLSVSGYALKSNSVYFESYTEAI